MWAVPVAWVGVVICSAASFLWLFLTRALRVIKAKTMIWSFNCSISMSCYIFVIISFECKCLRLLFTINRHEMRSCSKFMLQTILIHFWWGSSLTIPIRFIWCSDNLRERHYWLMKEQEAHGPHCSPEKTVQINKHMIIIMLLKRRKTDYLLYEKWIVLHLNKLESPSSKGALCQVLLKLAQWFWRRRWKC